MASEIDYNGEEVIIDGGINWVLPKLGLFLMVMLT